MDDVVVLIPCYNEELTIGKVVNDWKKELPDIKIYVYDNNSTDKSAEIALESGAIVVKETKQGKGNVVKSMFNDIDAMCYIMVDADDTYPAQCAKQFVDAIINEEYGMVIGDRLSSTYFTENKRPFHGIGNKIVRKKINRIYKSDIRDVMTGLRAFSYGFAKSFPATSKNFEVETEMTAFALENNFKIKNIIIEYRDRPEGSKSKLSTFKDGIKVLKLLHKLQKDRICLHK